MAIFSIFYAIIENDSSSVNLQPEQSTRFHGSRHWNWNGDGLEWHSISRLCPYFIQSTY